ncbi:hypothetical protein, partial [Dokdonella sp.]|uniref:hypothetical protein n=1 Tax=Dokdonella sp. TaxID=2291710 RepID=UPI002F42FC27
MISNRLQLLTLILFAAPVEAAALECQIDQVQEVRTDDPTFGTDLNLRGEARITVAKYKSQFVPVCSVVFGAQSHSSTYKDNCEHRNVILAGVLSRTSTDEASLTLIGAKTFEKVDIPMLAYSSTYKPVTNDDLVAYLRGKESSGQG